MGLSDVSGRRHRRRGKTEMSLAKMIPFGLEDLLGCY